MPNIAFPTAIPNGFVTFFNKMDDYAERATITTFSPTQVTATFGTTTFTFDGTGLATSVVGPNIYLTGGTINAITVTENTTDTIRLTGLSLQASSLYNAELAEEGETAGAPSSAIEQLFGRLGYTFTGSAGADVLLANARTTDNVLINLSGVDSFNLLGGNDNVAMGIGNDNVRGGTGNDSLGGGNGNDTLLGEGGNDVLRGGNGNDALNGSVGNDRFFGDAGNDRLYDGAGDDALSGGSGMDRLVGGIGRDTLSGGSERDFFVFANTASIGTSVNRDRITDFVSGVDRVDLRGLSLDALFTNGGGFSGTQAEARFVVSGGNGFVQIDADGNGSLDASLLLVGVTSIVATDILI